MKDALGHGSNAGEHAVGTQGVGNYYGRVSAKNGRALGVYGPHQTREAAHAEAMTKHPKAKGSSTSRGQYGMDIQFHKR